MQQTTHHPRKYYLIYSAVQFAVSRSRSRKRHSAPGGCSARNIFWFRCVDWLIQCMEECSGGGAVFFFTLVPGSVEALQLHNNFRDFLHPTTKQTRQKIALSHGGNQNIDAGTAAQVSVGIRISLMVLRQRNFTCRCLSVNLLFVFIFCRTMGRT